jgi:BMFP domain-containing protein YqiC
MAPKKKSVADYRNENAVLRSRLRDLEENFTTQSAGYAAAVKKLDEAEQRLAQVEAKFKISANTAEQYLEISNGARRRSQNSATNWPRRET